MEAYLVLALTFSSPAAAAPDAPGWPEEFALHCTSEHGVGTSHRDGWAEPRPVNLALLGPPSFRMGVRIGEGFEWSRGGDRGAETVEGHPDHVFISMRDGAPILRDDPTSTFVYRAGPGDPGGPFQMVWNESGHVTILFGHCVRGDLQPSPPG